MGNDNARNARDAARQEAWMRLRRQVCKLDAKVQLPGAAVRRMQLVKAPSFKPGYGWDLWALFTPQDTVEWQLYRRKVVDRPQLPGLRLRGYDRLDATQEFLEEWFTKMRRVPVVVTPLIPPPPFRYIRKDGTHWEFALFGDSGSSARFTWGSWLDEWQEWRPLMETAEELADAFSALPVLPEP